MYSLIITGAPEVGPVMVEQIRKGDSLSQGLFLGLLFAHTLCPSPRDSPSPLDSWKHNCRSQEAQAACRRSKHLTFCESESVGMHLQNVCLPCRKSRGFSLPLCGKGCEGPDPWELGWQHWRGQARLHVLPPSGGRDC